MRMHRVQKKKKEKEKKKEIPVQLHSATNSSALTSHAGYFKDKHDSYSGLYYLVAACCACVAVLWCVIVTADSIKGLIQGRPTNGNSIAIPA